MEPINETPRTGNKSKLWILYGLLGGLFYALGNVAFGINCTQSGVWAVGFIGPSTFVLILIYRMVHGCLTKKCTGYWIDKSNSNYWAPSLLED